jgi:hypothetical protein
MCVWVFTSDNGATTNSRTTILRGSTAGTSWEASFADALAAAMGGTFGVKLAIAVVVQEATRPGAETRETFAARAFFVLSARHTGLELGNTNTVHARVGTSTMPVERTLDWNTSCQVAFLPRVQLTLT